MDSSADPSETKNWYISIWKHPLTLLLIGSVLSYVLIPWITEKSSHKQLLQQQRIDRACDVLKQGLVDDEQLNSIQTAFEIFDKEADSDPDSYKAAQVELKSQFSKLYYGFDQHGWWWDHDLPVQSRLLELPPGSDKKIERLHDAYKQNLLDSVQQVDELRKQFFAKNFKPRAPHNEEVLASTHKTLNDLATVRGGLTSQLASIFMPSSGRP
jgi:hypothetical protein